MARDPRPGEGAGLQPGPRLKRVPRYPDRCCADQMRAGADVGETQGRLGVHCPSHGGKSTGAVRQSPFYGVERRGRCRRCSCENAREINPGGMRLAVGS